MRRLFRLPAAALVLIVAAGALFAGEPPLLLLHRADLQRVKRSAARENSRYRPALEELRRQAEVALRQGPWSVTAKKLTPPSGDKHDYMSFGPYWWPDPSNPEGPYIRRDGERNPEALTSDKASLTHLRDALQVLGPAYFYFGDERYARHGMKLIRAWFLNESTRMNPHFRFAQAVPGRSPGRPAGLIESRRFLAVLDAFTLFRASPACTAEDVRGMQRWVDRFLHWMLTDKNGRREARSGNNHETSYALQVAAFALFLERNDLARSEFEKHFKRRIVRQIEPGGRMPRELARTKALSYSLFNVRLMMQLAFLAENLDVDLFHFETEDGRGIRTALDFLLPYLAGEKKWPYRQIEPLRLQTLEAFFVLSTARRVYGDARYGRLLEKIFGPSLLRQIGNVLWPLW